MWLGEGRHTRLSPHLLALAFGRRGWGMRAIIQRDHVILLFYHDTLLQSHVTLLTMLESQIVALTISTFFGLMDAS